MTEKNQIRILIVEDEYITMETLTTVLTEMNYAISGDAMSAAEAIEVLEKGETDFAILDINIKGEHDGIWLAQQIKEKYKIPFIFLTAFGDKATVQRAIEAEPHGYLVKPFNKTDIFTAIEVALINYAKQNKTVSKESTSSKKDEDDSHLIVKDSIFIKDDYAYVKLKMNEILFIKSDKNYLEIHLENKRHLVRGKLSDFFENLPQDEFIQVHRSYIISLNAIDSIGSNFVKVKTTEIPVSGNYKDDLKSKLRIF
ncbi:MAG: response regulator [Crocinitomicaceae bacterium]|nr:response regulator [Crocinitomicaceae bacterium]